MRLRHARSLASTFTILMGLVWAGSAAAVPITFSFTGIVRAIDDPAGADPFAASIGDLVVGSYTFPSDAPFSGDPNFGGYVFSSTFPISIGGVTAAGSSSSQMAVGIQGGVSIYGVVGGH